MEIQVAQRAKISDIVTEYGSRLTGFIRKRVKRLEDAEDILQEVFYQLAEADRLMKPIDEMAAWLFTVARNRITDSYRKKKPELLPEFYTDEDFKKARAELGELLAKILLNVSHILKNRAQKKRSQITPFPILFPRVSKVVSGLHHFQ